MENRALLAFVLSLAAFVVWGYLLSLFEDPRQKQLQQQQKAQQQKNAVEGENQAAPGASLPSAPSAGQTATPASSETTAVSAETKPMFAGNEEQIAVNNGRSTIVLSNKGAVIEKVLMNKYHDHNGDPIDLVKHAEGAKLPLTLVSGNNTVNNILQNAFYEVSPKSLDLTPSNPTGTINFRLRHESGLEATRTLTFHYDQYLIDVQTHITASAYAGQNLEYMVLWGPGLGGEVNSHTDHFAFSGATSFLNGERVETPADKVTDIIKHRGELEWTSFQNKYFAAVLIPKSGVKSAITKKDKSDLYVGLEFESVQSSASAEHLIYIGTKELQTLETIGYKLARLIDYGWVGNKFAFLVKPLLKVLQYFYSVTGNYGWSIIILTIIIKVLFFPLTHKSFKSMRGLQKIQPYVKVIQERNKDDRQKMNEEMIELYKKHKVNPLGGCLPMLLQIPVFISLYHALFFSIELRGAPFMAWITDLSEADPYYVTPVVMGATMMLQQKMTPQVGDPMQQKIMLIMPVVFTFLFVTFPAGLVIYWTVNNVLTIAQQYYIYKIAKD